MPAFFNLLFNAVASSLPSVVPQQISYFSVYLDMEIYCAVPVRPCRFQAFLRKYRGPLLDRKQRVFRGSPLVLRRPIALISGTETPPTGFFDKFFCYEGEGYRQFFPEISRNPPTLYECQRCHWARVCDSCVSIYSFLELWDYHSSNEFVYYPYYVCTYLYTYMDM